MRFPDAVVTFVEGTGWVAPPLEDVPDAALCVDAACTQPGLTVEDFTNPRFEGTPKTRLDKNAAYRWGWPTREQRDGTVRWTGYIKPDENGRYRFRYAGDAGYRIWINDRLIADVWDIAWPTSDTEVALTAGKPVKRPRRRARAQGNPQILTAAVTAAYPTCAVRYPAPA